MIKRKEKTMKARKLVSIPMDIYDRLVKRKKARQPVAGVIEDLLDQVEGKIPKSELKDWSEY